MSAATPSTDTATASAAAPSTDRILDVDELNVTFRTSTGPLHAVRGIGFEVGAGETVGLVGESGSGKSATVLGMLGLFHTQDAVVRADRLDFESVSLLGSNRRSQLKDLLGLRIGIIFQDPQSSLNPTMRIGRQIGEGLALHRGLARSETRARVLEALDEVGIGDPEWCASAYPHELSGGMRQRAMIAMATIGDPALLIADEPTTALDVTLQAQVIDLLGQMQRSHGSGILFITHDLALVSEFADRILVMYAGRIVESGSTETVIKSPSHPYTRALISSVPVIDGPDVEPIAGRPPDPRDLPSGCPFHPRCPLAEPRCTEAEPPMFRVSSRHGSRCWLSETDEGGPC